MVCLAVAQVLLGFASERRWLRFARSRLGHLFPYLPKQPAYNRRLRAAGPAVARVIRHLACSSPSWWDQLRLLDSTPVPCASSRETVKRSDLAGVAAYGYCRSHHRYFWGLRLYLLCAPDGMPVAWCLAKANLGERDVAASLLENAVRPGQVVLADKGFAGRDFEAHVEDLGARLLRPDRKDEPRRFGSLGGLRQWVESVFDTLKGQLSLEDHGGRTPGGVFVRVAQRLLALAAAVWWNWELGEPVKRSLVAYDHRGRRPNGINRLGAEERAGLRSGGRGGGTSGRRVGKPGGVDRRGERSRGERGERGRAPESAEGMRASGHGRGGRLRRPAPPRGRAGRTRGPARGPGCEPGVVAVGTAGGGHRSGRSRRELGGAGPHAAVVVDERLGPHGVGEAPAGLAVVVDVADAPPRPHQEPVGEAVDLDHPGRVVPVGAAGRCLLEDLDGLEPSFAGEAHPVRPAAPRPVLASPGRRREAPDVAGLEVLGGDRFRSRWAGLRRIVGGPGAPVGLRPAAGLGVAQDAGELDGGELVLAGPGQPAGRQPAVPGHRQHRGRVEAEQPGYLLGAQQRRHPLEGS